MSSYTIKPFSKQRENITLVAAEGWRKHSIHALVEMDITYARKLLRKYRDITGEKLSFTAWLIRCVAQAISEHSILNTYRHGRRKMVVFEDIDIAIPVERAVEGEFRPLGYIIKGVNKKTVKDISDEIKSIQYEEVDTSKEVLGKKLSRFEKFVIRSPMFIKKNFVTYFKEECYFKNKTYGNSWFNFRWFSW